MVSPADGKVSAVFDVEHHEAIGGPAKVIRIFLSVLDVHVNRFPCDGVVQSVVNTPGRYLDARTAESAKVNENTMMVLTTASGERIGVRQISGAIARRIVCDLHVGDHVDIGETYGLIRFGSRLDTYLPAGAEVLMESGQRTLAGETVMARLP
jgi:phosphatidylserine decarboxylase